MVNIKTEIPKESSGRLIDALTDIIRPFSERRGLKADQIRLQREEVLIEIARRAKRRAELEGLSIQPVPNKVLVPLLENASNEQPDSPFLDWWTNLLLSAAEPGARSRPYFAELISKLGPPEAKLLERLWSSFPKTEELSLNSRAFAVTTRLRPAFERLIEDALEVSRLTSDGQWEATYERKFEIATINFQRDWEKRGILFSGVRLKLKAGGKVVRTNLEHDQWISVDVCKALRLLEETTFSCEADAIDLSNRVHTVSFVTFTDLGVEFMRATHRPDLAPQHLMR